MIAGYRTSAPYYGSFSDFCTKKSTLSVSLLLLYSTELTTSTLAALILINLKDETLRTNAAAETLAREEIVISFPLFAVS